MKILILDNYDSFTYNLVHYVRELTDAEVTVARNDKISLKSVKEYTHILLSPGPGLPKDAGIMNDLIRTYSKTSKIFGVCLGMQAIGEVFGGELTNLKKVFHGLSRPIRITDFDEVIFKGIPQEVNVGRYHSWIVNHDNLPEDLSVTAVDEDDRIMALKHKTLDVRGVQFHPESVLTEHGKKMIENWLKS